MIAAELILRRRKNIVRLASLVLSCIARYASSSRLATLTILFLYLSTLTIQMVLVQFASLSGIIENQLEIFVHLCLLVSV